MGRTKKYIGETVKSSFVMPAELHKNLLRIARYKGLNLNPFLVAILEDYINRNAEILAVLDETDKRIAEIQSRSEKEVGIDENC